jgi:hypothetical protein
MAEVESNQLAVATPEDSTWVVDTGRPYTSI